MTTYSEAKLPVTMRLPRQEVEIIQKYAQSAGITKTEAFLHFLKLGIEHSEYDTSKLSHVETLLEEILRRLPNISDIDSETVNEVIREEASHFSAIQSAILFGSFARGEATQNSDIDIRLMVDRKNIFSLYDLARFQKAVQQKTGRKVDVITVDDINNKNLAAAIAREGIVVYERKTQ